MLLTELVTERALPVHALMDQFALHAGELLVGGERLSQLAARVGQTPFYAYDRALLRTRVQQLRRVLPAAVKLHYAMKANPMPALVGRPVLHRCEVEFDAFVGLAVPPVHFDDIADV